MRVHLHTARRATAVAAGLVAIAIGCSAPAGASGAAPSSANYLGGGIGAKASMALTTSADGAVESYTLGWNRTVCGIRQFGLSFKAPKASAELAVDDAGEFSEAFSLIYTQGLRRYRVRALTFGRFGTYAPYAGRSDDQVYVQQQVKVRPLGKNAEWCRVDAQEFVGYRQ